MEGWRVSDHLATFTKRLKDFLTADSLLVDKSDCEPFGTDWTKQKGMPPLVVLPKTTEEVAKILRTANELGIAIVPSGGRTGLAGGAVAAKGEVVLSLSRMARIDPIDRISRSVRVQAGAITQTVHEHCEAAGLQWPIDLAAKGTSQIGGNLSTNAGGLKVVRYGMARKWVSALQIVTMQGEVIELNRGLEKNNTGYSLTQLLIGSEGTLAVITEAELKLTRIPKHLSVFLFSVRDLEHLAILCELAQFGPFEINAMEFFSQRCLRTVEEKLKKKCRLQNAQPYYVVLEVETPTASADELEAWLSELIEKAIITDGYRGESSADCRAIWDLREGITESIAQTGRVRKHDIAVPLSKMVPFLTEGQKAFERMKMGADLYIFGHFADGSPHFNIVKHPGTDNTDFDHGCDRYDGELYSLLKKYGGSVSAEHGIGNLKKPWLPYSRTPRELEIYRHIKKAFDPKGLLNPGKIIDHL